MSDNYRFYFFTNFYVSSIQKGIQAGHCAVELMNGKFRDCQITREWATNDKTFIILNGGAQPELENILEILNKESAKGNITLPYAHFVEDAGLNHAMTCVGLIVPKRIYDFTSANRGISIQEEEGQMVVRDYRGREVAPVVKYQPKVGNVVTDVICEVNLSHGDLIVASLLLGKSLAN